MNTALDRNGNEIKAGSLVRSKNSKIIRVVLGNEDGSIIHYLGINNDSSRIRGLRKDSDSQDWTFLKPSNVEVIG